MTDNNNESFIAEYIGNFFDCINNSIYNLQKYIDKFYKFMPNVFVSINDTSISDDVKEVLKFVSSENENIIKSKGLSFILEVSNLLIRKYTSLTDEMKKPKNNGCKYIISKTAYSFFDKFQNDIEWEKLQMNMYAKSEHNTVESLDFISYSLNEFKKMELIEFEVSDRMLPFEDFIRILDIGLLKLTTSITSLKKIAEGSQSITCTSLCCKKVITLMILVFHVMKTIKISYE